MCDKWRSDFLNFYNWSMNHGYEEGLHIDRIDNDGNYEPNNCQFITQAENNAVGKQRKRTDNTSGYVGIYFRDKTNKWEAQISIDKNQIFLGAFGTKEDAINARINAEIKYLGEQKTNFPNSH